MPSSLSSNATVPASPQTTLPSRSFQATLVHASTQGGVQAKPVDDAAKDGRGNELGPNGDESASAAPKTADFQEEPEVAAAATTTGDGPTTEPMVQGDALLVAPGSVETTLPPAVESSAEAYFHVGIGDEPTRAGGLSDVGGQVEGGASMDSGAPHAAAKQDRSRTRTGEAASEPSTSGVAVIDLSQALPLSLSRWRGAMHGDGGRGAAGNTKDATVAISTESHRRPTATKEETSAGATAACADPTHGPDGGAGVVETGVLAVAGFQTHVAAEVLVQTPGGDFGGVPSMNSTTGKGSGPLNLDSSKISASVATSSVAAGGTADSPVRSDANAGQLSTSLEQGSSRLASVTAARGVDDLSWQGGAQPVIHDGAGTQRPLNGQGDATHTVQAEKLFGGQAAPGEVAASSGINSAKVLQTMGQSEMHVGMHSEEFGDISIRTSVSQQQMVTQISLTHGDLSQAMTAHLMNVQTKLGEEYGLHASIQINNQGAPLAGDQGDPQQRGQQTYAQTTKGNMMGATELKEAIAGVITHESAVSGHGLDIRI